jgi:hypothetical protein
LTVFTDGPALVVSPTRVGVLLGNNIAIKATVMAAAKRIGSRVRSPLLDGDLRPMMLRIRGRQRGHPAMSARPRTAVCCDSPADLRSNVHG